jgi:hypothetical protein
MQRGGGVRACEGPELRLFIGHGRSLACAARTPRGDGGLARPALAAGPGCASAGPERVQVGAG